MEKKLKNASTKISWNPNKEILIQDGIQLNQPLMKFLNLYPQETQEIKTAQEIELAQREAKIELASNSKILISTLNFTKERNLAKVFLKKEISTIQTL